MIRHLSMALLLASAAAANAVVAPYPPTLTSAPAQMAGVNGWTSTPIYTIGDTLPDGFQAVGIPDGIGAYRLDSKTVRVFVNAELGNTAGKSYSLANGTSLPGARIQYFDIDRKTKGVVNAGIGYSKIFDRAGAEVTNASQVGGGINRLCSASLYEANSFGSGRGLADRLYFAGEENGNGTAYALDPSTQTLYAVPSLGRASYENVALVDTGRTDTVAFLIADDSSGANLRLYVGTKSSDPAASVLERNGLVGGKLYAWKADNGDNSPADFNGGNGDSRSGSWVELTVQDATKAGTAGYDSLGYADNSTLTSQGTAAGAMTFARVEDMATNPGDSTLVAFVTTGSAFDGGADTWGNVFTIDIDFGADGSPTTGNIEIVYNGDLDPTHALRSPDNLDWNGPNQLLIQEDRSADWASVVAANPNEAGILNVGLDGTVDAVGRITRAVPLGQVDIAVGELGNWESSGILDVSTLFGLTPGRLFIGDVQAHGIRLSSPNLVEGGQIFLLSAAVPEPGTWAMLIAGFGVVGFAARRRRAAMAIASA